jgi:hypothetical protein
MEPTMTFSVIVHSSEGQFEASLVGAPDVRASAPTRVEALAALETVIENRVRQGELVNLEIGRKGLAGLFGKYRDDPTLQDICDEADKQRGGTDANDPHEQAYLEALARDRQEDLEQTLRELDQECSNSSSIPIT